LNTSREALAGQRPGRITGGAGFLGTYGNLRFTWPFAECRFDDERIEIDLRFTFVRVIAQGLARIRGAKPLPMELSWSARWVEIREVRLGRSGAVLIRADGGHCVFLAVTRRRFGPLRAALTQHARCRRVRSIYVNTMLGVR